MDEKTAKFLKSLFARFYTARGPVPPPKIERREFAFMLFGEKMVIRHKAFISYDELVKFMAELGPSDAFYSSAYFKRPDAPDMRSKGWLGADLIFDIDADHIPTSCKTEHDLWICRSCGRSGRGEAPEKCPECGSAGFLELKWLCDKCLTAAKDELMKLIDILANELGFGEDAMRASFSGHRGYHLQVSQEGFLELGQDERREIVDYLLGIGLDPELLGFGPGAKLSISEVGWRGRLARSLYSLLLRADEKELKALGLRRRAIKALLASREMLLDCLEHGRPLVLPKGLGKASLKRLLEACSKQEAVCVDPVVTCDTHRLVRMSGSLHGKTGLLKVDIPLDRLEDFDPFSEAIAFRKGMARIRLTEDFPTIPSIELGGEEFGPFEAGETVELPLYAAVFFICKGVASLG